MLTQDQMTQDTRDAVVAIEDRRFYTHAGLDLRSILRAAAVDIENGRVVEGGSTITQQLVKNLYTGNEQSFRRKLEEAALAVQMEQAYSKDDILTSYINTVYFGEGAYGIEAAAKTYFGVHASELTLSESAMLAGLITAPNHFDPLVRPASAEGRRNVVLGIMREMGTITASEQRHARAEAIRVHPGTQEEQYPYPYFVDYVKRWFLANKAFGRTYDDRYRLLFTGGLRITTTLDPAVQADAQDAVTSVLTYPSDPDAAVTVLDPRTGFVRAMVGGRDADYWANVGAGRVNLATGSGGSGRQTGSAFKAFALVAALENGYSADTTFPAPASITLPLPGGGTWPVTNSDGEGYGTLSLRTATEKSVNTVYAQLIQALGADTVVRVATQMGLRCCTDVGQPDRPAARGRQRGARLQRGQHAWRWPAPTARWRPAGGASHRCRSSRWSAPTARSCGRRLPSRRRSSTHRSRPQRTTSCKTWCSTERAPPPTSAARRSARRAPTTTTTTPGSSGRCRSWPRRCGSGSTKGRSRWSRPAPASPCSAGPGPHRSGAS